MADRAGVVPQLLGAAVGIVLGATLLFAVLGMLRDDEPTPEVADDAPIAASEGTDDGAATEDVTDEGDATDEPSEEPAGEPSDDASDEPSEEPSAEPEPEPEPSPEPEPEPTEDPAPAQSVDPAEISIQVLDAIGGEGGSAAANAVADELREAGYNVVVVNRAGRSYETTTVFWSEGQEAGGRQVAAELGTSEAEQTPTEVQLSNSVDVHVVVGADRA